MSWLIGVFGMAKEKYLDKIAYFVKGDDIVSNDLATMFICSSNRTLISGRTARSNSSFVVNGVGLFYNGNDYRFMNESDWSEFAESDYSAAINGHYILTILSKDKLQILTDRYGIREIYYTCLEDETYLFSTRIDWIQRVTNSETEIGNFGARWLLSNSIGDELPLKNVFKLNKGKSLVFDGLKLIINESENIQDELTDNFEATLKKIIQLKLPDYFQRAFLLSGGIDSRILLSLFSKEGLKETNFYTFGDSSSADILVAKILAKELNIKHITLHTPIIEPEEFLKEFQEYSRITFANNPLTSFAMSYNLNRIEPESFVLDGGFGEIWRNGFARKLYFFGKSAIEKKDTQKILKFIQYNRGSFLSDDLLDMMKSGCIALLDEYFEKFPYNSGMNYRHYINNFCLSNRLPNYYAPEQAYTDSKIPSIMPFAQQNLLRHINSQNTSSNKFKAILSKNNSNLAKFPLAKNNNMYSFRFPLLHSILMKYIRKFNNKQQIQDYTNIDCLKSYVLDILSSKEVRQNPLYEQIIINNLKDEVNKTTRNIFANRELDWFLTFHYSIFNQI